MTLVMGHFVGIAELRGVGNQHEAAIRNNQICDCVTTALFAPDCQFDFLEHTLVQLGKYFGYLFQQIVTIGAVEFVLDRCCVGSTDYGL